MVDACIRVIPIQDDIIVALFAWQFVGRSNSRDGQERFEKQGQTRINRVGDFNVLFTPEIIKCEFFHSRHSVQLLKSITWTIKSGGIQLYTWSVENDSLLVHLQAPCFQLHWIPLHRGQLRHTAKQFSHSLCRNATLLMKENAFYFRLLKRQCPEKGK